MPWSSFSECWALSQHFYSPLTLSWRGSFYHKGGVICISEVIYISSGNLDSNCASSSPAFLMINKQGENIQPRHIPFLIWNQTVGPWPVLTVASWPAYRLLRRQVRWSGIPMSWRIFQFVVIHTDKSFGVVNEAVDVFLGFSCFLPWSSGCWQFNLWFFCPI